ncbi:hypothetical protein [Azospirillum argentinense]
MSRDLFWGERNQYLLLGRARFKEMSIVREIFLRRQGGLTRKSFASPEPLSSRLWRVPSFLQREEAELLRGKLISLVEHVGTPLVRSWAADRYEIFNHEFAMLYATKGAVAVEAAYNKRVVFTYNFNSYYPHNVALSKHIDRKGCDVNLLIYLGENSTLDTSNMKNPVISVEDGDETIDARGNMGDAFIFLGRLMPHFRLGAPERCGLLTAILHYDFSI